VRPDDVGELEAVLRAAVGAHVDVVLTTGGAGLSPTDVTPEATRRVLER
jgi:molybdopterin biosynthesis enzyme MoaB